jgi:hypothetical protein
MSGTSGASSSGYASFTIFSIADTCKYAKEEAVRTGAHRAAWRACQWGMCRTESSKQQAVLTAPMVVVL